MCTSDKDRAIISIEEYRKITQNKTISDDEIKKQVDYLEAFCHNIINLELKRYYEQCEETT
jgi:hypothetical protein